MAKNNADPSVRINETAAENATRLLDEMRLYGVETSREKLVRALFWGVTAPQAAGMVSAFILESKRSGNEPSRAGAAGNGSAPVDEAPPPDAPDG
jgi:hypothetical protein